MGQKVSFYTDEHTPKAVVRALQQRGVDVLSVQDTGMFGATDAEHVQRAHSEGRTIFSQDDDFLRLHAAGIEHAGIVYAAQGTSIGKMVHGLMLIYAILDAQDMKGHVEYL